MKRSLEQTIQSTSYPSFVNFGTGIFVASHQSPEVIHATEMGC